jgi:tRNA dimethylallyltransferase
MNTPLALIKPVALIGPTCSGKTAAALAFAASMPSEIISIDSALVYRGMDVGTAKPHAAELAAVPHHLINTLDPTQSYSAADFVRDATRLIAEIQARGNTPLLVGGTMLYIKALIEGIDDLPQANAALRAQLDAQAAQIGWPAMHAELMRVDPLTAARLSPNDSQRIQRALEVFHASGKPMSAYFSAAPRPRMDLPVVALDADSRTWLHARIAQRFDAMLDAGLIEEVAALRARGDLTADMPSMRCVGYRQVWQALDTGLSGAALRAQVRETGTAATRQLAKRQITWLRGFAQSGWRLQRVACDAPNANAAALVALKTFISP